MQKMKQYSKTMCFVILCNAYLIKLGIWPTPPVGRTEPDRYKIYKYKKSKNCFAHKIIFLWYYNFFSMNIFVVGILDVTGGSRVRDVHACRPGVRAITVCNTYHKKTWNGNAMNYQFYIYFNIFVKNIPVDEERPSPILSILPGCNNFEARPVGLREPPLIPLNVKPVNR